MKTETTTIEVEWGGPFSWPGYEISSNLPPLPPLSGLYLQTFEYQGDYLIYAAGVTRRPVSARLREHTKKYMNGEYNVLNISAAQRGFRKVLWRGWEYARQNREEFEEGKPAILQAVSKQLEGFCVFVADIGTAPRILERLEAAVMNNLYRQPSPICDIPDVGMFLAGRWDSEDPIIVKNNCTARPHGLPRLLEI